ncbi:hypothetical protein [Burkholderia ubonensis]|uniref:hypothetical protein n=1 Tax=Burkholderia ubonensis TaxID=101571 RepID=UPI000AFB9A31|nr:hypothetical protein [Burkholderia ubonensis]
MIRSKRLQLPQLNQWFVTVPLPVGKNHTLQAWEEKRAALQKPFKDDVLAYFDEAYDDARRHVREGFEDSLCSFNDPATDPAANLPRLLHRITQQGHLGEALGALAAEHWGAAGHTDWQVPALLFRFHTTELQHLASINERIVLGVPFNQDDNPEIRPGRTGDDALAFRMNAAGEITDVLVIEAKCVSANSNATIIEAHEKLSTVLTQNSGIRELVNVLAKYDTADAKKWRAALLALWQRNHASVRRINSVSYAVGAIPKKPKSRKSWMDPLTREPKYTGTHALVGWEFQIADLDGMVDILYRGK